MAPIIRSKSQNTTDDNFHECSSGINNNCPSDDVSQRKSSEESKIEDQGESASAMQYPTCPASHSQQELVQETPKQPETTPSHSEPSVAHQSHTQPTSINWSMHIMEFMLLVWMVPDQPSPARHGLPSAEESQLELNRAFRRARKALSAVAFAWAWNERLSYWGFSAIIVCLWPQQAFSISQRVLKVSTKVFQRLFAPQRD